MKFKIVIMLAIVTAALAWSATGAVAGKVGRPQGPPLDHSLMAFKEQGVWYFLCTAPAYPVRIGPHFATYAPPPPLCAPPAPQCNPRRAPRPPTR